MRRKDKEITDQKIIDQILLNSYICRIAIYDTPYPYIIPMNYGYKDNSLYFHCATKGRKLDLIRKNGKVGFEIEEYHEVTKDKESCKWTTNYRSIIGYGDIEIIEDAELKEEKLDIIMNHHGRSENSYNKKAVDKILILKLNIKNMTAKQSGDYKV